MPYPTVEEFERLLMTESLEKVAKDNVLCLADPIIFQEKPVLYKMLHRHLTGYLGLKDGSLSVVGSSKIGFSLDPDNFPAAVHEGSDIDVLIVSESLFDRIWISLLDWFYDFLARESNGAERAWFQNVKHAVFRGRIDFNMLRPSPDVGGREFLKPMRDARNLWFDAFRSISENRLLAKWETTGRLYRTWDHALRYHVDGLRQIKKKVARKV
jgi:hypothetical protein